GEDVVGHEGEAGVRELLPRGDEREDRQPLLERQAEAWERGVDHLTVEIRIWLMLDAPPLAGGAAAAEDLHGRRRGEGQRLEGGGRHGRHAPPIPHRLRRGTPTLAEPAVRLDALELPGERRQRQLLERRRSGIGEESGDAVEDHGRDFVTALPCHSERYALRSPHSSGPSLPEGERGKGKLLWERRAGVVRASE